MHTRRLFSEIAVAGPQYQRVVEQIRNGKAPLMFTCEHGGQEDFWLRKSLFKNGAETLKGTHWAYDLGAADLTRDLIRATASRGIICHVTRLFCDVNRPVGSPTLARLQCDGVEIEFNRGLDEKERRSRIEKVWLPYHVRAAALADELPTMLVTSIHSFSREYEGSRRDHIEIGVLSSFDDSVAIRVIEKLKKDGFNKVLHNEPWSVFAADQLVASQTKHRRNVTIEVRNDLLERSKPENKVFIDNLVKSLSEVLLQEAQISRLIETSTVNETEKVMSVDNNKSELNICTHV